MRLREHLIDDHDRRAGRTVVLVELTTRQNGCTNRTEVGRPDRLWDRRRAFEWSIGGSASNIGRPSGGAQNAERAMLRPPPSAYGVLRVKWL